MYPPGLSLFMTSCLTAAQYVKQCGAEIIAFTMICDVMALCLAFTRLDVTRSCMAIA